MKFNINTITLFLGLIIVAFGISQYSSSNGSKTTCQPPTNSVAPITNQASLLNIGINDLFSNRLAEEFVYDVDSRFLMTMTKDELSQVRSMEDFISAEHYSKITSFSAVSVSLLDDTVTAVEKESGTSKVFNLAQLNILQNAPYSSNLMIRADFQESYNNTGVLVNNYTTPHLTIVPEKEAEYSKGSEALLVYLRENSKDDIKEILFAQLKPGKVEFTVTTSGEVSNINLLSTSGYTSLDDKMIELISTTPEKWQPASNSNGEKVEQELVFSFGKMGC